MHKRLLKKVQKQLNRGKISFSTGGTGATNIHGENINLNLTIYLKIRPKWNIGINVKYKSIKILEENKKFLRSKDRPKVLRLDTKSTIPKKKN